MTQLVWGQLGDRRYEIGLDRGVLYLPDNSGVAWSGLISVDERPSDDSQPYYVDGVKYLDAEMLGDFAASLKAYTYPDEFEQVTGVGSYGNGLLIQDQQPKTFGMSYRTRLANDTTGEDLGYQIHILYNLMAAPDVVNYDSNTNRISPLAFSWSLVGTPVVQPGYRPTGHIVIDSTEIQSDFLAFIERILYGTATEKATLPSMADLVNIALAWDTIVIVDHGDGTWTAEGYRVGMMGDTEFFIMGANAVYTSPDTYQISST